MTWRMERAALALLAVAIAGCTKEERPPRSLPKPSPISRSRAEDANVPLPKTYEQAVARIVAGLSERDRRTVRAVPTKLDMIQFHHGWGTGIRNEFGLWSGNTALMRSCSIRAGLDANKWFLHPDDASAYILEGVWETLHPDAPPGGVSIVGPKSKPAAAAP